MPTATDLPAVTEEIPPPTPPPPPTGLSRRQLLGRGLAGLCAVTVAADIYAQQIEPYLVQYHDVPLPVRNLPRAFEGFRIAQLTDLHITTKIESQTHVQRVVDAVNRAKPDLVVVTGDLITAGHGHLETVAAALALLQPQTFVCLGNHDYGEYLTLEGKHHPNASRPFVNQLNEIGKRVLMNQSVVLERGDEQLWIVGLEDWLVGHFNLEKALSKLPPDAATLVLSHNPDSAEVLDDPRVSALICGHTHGGQVRIPFLGPVYLNIRNRQWGQGYFQLKHSTMYVSRGVGYLMRIRFDCRPEVPTFVLRGT